MNSGFLFSLFSLTVLTFCAHAGDSCESTINASHHNDQLIPYSAPYREIKIPPVFQIFPPIIYNLYYQYPYDENIKIVRTCAYALQNGEKISSAYLIEIMQKLCCSRKLSPQTSDALIETCTSIAQGKSIPWCNPLLGNYNPQRELENKYMFIHQMPTIVRDICLSNPDDELERPLIIGLFAKTEEKFALLAKISEHGQKIYESKSTIDFQHCLNSLMGGLLFGRSSLLISPQTLLRTATEFKQRILENTIPSLYPYNVNDEIYNINTVIDLFPHSLTERCRPVFSSESQKFLQEGNGNGRTFKHPKLYACLLLTLHALILTSSPDRAILLEQCKPKFKSDIEYNIAWIFDAISRSGEIEPAQHTIMMQKKDEFIHFLIRTKKE